MEAPQAMSPSPAMRRTLRQLFRLRPVHTSSRLRGRPAPQATWSATTFTAVQFPALIRFSILHLSHLRNSLTPALLTTSPTITSSPPSIPVACKAQIPIRLRSQSNDRLSVDKGVDSRDLARIRRRALEAQGKITGPKD